jgi:hypothetical protein
LKFFQAEEETTMEDLDAIPMPSGGKSGKPTFAIRLLGLDSDEDDEHPSSDMETDKPSPATSLSDPFDSDDDAPILLPRKRAFREEPITNKLEFSKPVKARRIEGAAAAATTPASTKKKPTAEATAKAAGKRVESSRKKLDTANDFFDTADKKLRSKNDEYTKFQKKFLVDQGETGESLAAAIHTATDKHAAAVELVAALLEASKEATIKYAEWEATDHEKAFIDYREKKISIVTASQTAYDERKVARDKAQAVYDTAVKTSEAAEIALASTPARIPAHKKAVKASAAASVAKYAM